MGTGASTGTPLGSDLPKRLTLEQCKTFSGVKFSQVKFNEFKGEDGMISKGDLLKLNVVSRAVAEGDAKGDMAAATANKIDWAKCHSVIRWNKPLLEVSQVITTPFASNSVDSKNGNYPIHIAAQNGHLNLVQWLVEEGGARVDVQNGTGQTPLHMSISYDYADVVNYLISRGANSEITNWNGHPAKFGIDGDKDPADPMVMFEVCDTTEGAMLALSALEEKVLSFKNTAPVITVEAAAVQGAVEVPVGTLEKVKVAMLGLQVKKGNKKLSKELWTRECQTKFTAVLGGM